MEFLHYNNFDLNDVVAIGCDGTAVNTGCKSGVIRLLEEKLEKPLHWFVCLLHSNELPLRHIDGKTSGPATFTGPIGSKPRDSFIHSFIYFLFAIKNYLLCNTYKSKKLQTSKQQLNDKRKIVIVINKLYLTSLPFLVKLSDRIRLN